MVGAAVASDRRLLGALARGNDMSQERIPSLAYTIAAWVLTGVALVLILLLHLLPALLAGMLVYELVHLMEPAIHKRFPERRETLIAVALLSGLVLVLMAAAIIGLIAFFTGDAGSVSALLAKMAEIIESSQATICLLYKSDAADESRGV